MKVSKFILPFVLALLLSSAITSIAHGIIGFSKNSPTQKPVPLNQYTGVVYLEEVSCSGSLLIGGRYVLTAAHCVTDDGKIPSDLSITVIFKLPSGNRSIPVSRFFVHPGWSGYESEVGNDVAVLKLAANAPSAVEQYDLYRDRDEIGKIFTKVGYGYIGTGSKGQDEGSNEAARRYAGQNRYEILVDRLKEKNTESDFSELVLGSQLLFDFDSGKAGNDTFGRHFGIRNLGLGVNEIATGNGDSGGPSFINGKIAGVSSWGFSDRGFFSRNIADIDDVDDNGSFGEISGDTRVSFYARWIDQITKGS